jgi:predicted DNA-binding protein
MRVTRRIGYGRIRPTFHLLVGHEIDWYGKSMAKTHKMTFTLDEETAARIDRTAARLGIPKSAVVREAVAEYAAGVGRVSESERLRALQTFDELVGRIPLRPAKDTDAELATLRDSRRHGGRRSAAERGS